MKVLILTLITQLILKAHESDCIRLTNMTAPAVQDPRNEMRLHCRFDMGGEQLYAVKWYKDDHEFFRYTPSGKEMVKFPVTGVNVDSAKSTCNRNSCDLVLKNIEKPHSSGAYRCEVSSEAPAFRLASETHKVIVAALPEQPPVIEGVKPTYYVGDTLIATCTSGLGDPKPSLTFHINKQQVTNGVIRELSTDPVHDAESNINLKKSKIQLRLTLDRKISATYLNLPTELSCVSTTEDIPRTVPSLATSRTFTVMDQNQVVNNQKFRWADPANSSTTSPIQNSYSRALVFFLVCMSAISNYIRSR